MQFPTTQWSLLAEATLHGEGGATAALAEFCRRYRTAIVVYIRIRGFGGTDAEDLAHDFLVHVMEKSTLRRANAARGRFRSFLIGSLVRFLGDEIDRRKAAKRGGGLAPVSLDDSEARDDLATLPPPGVEAFDREWALGLLSLALEKVGSEYAARGREKLFAVLRAFVPGGASPPSYDVAAADAGIEMAAFKTEVHRMRQRFKSAVREEIGATVSSPNEIAAEIADLGKILRTDPT